MLTLWFFLHSRFLWRSLRRALLVIDWLCFIWWEWFLADGPILVCLYLWPATRTLRSVLSLPSFSPEIAFILLLWLHLAIIIEKLLYLKRVLALLDI